MPTAVLTASTGSTSSDTAQPHRYSLLLSNDLNHRLAAQTLRYAVFAAEPGFHMPQNATGRDADHFDDYCDHLLVREDATGSFVGCYRMLPPEGACAAGGYYTETEFDVSGLAPLERQIVEMGRACVLPEHRHGAVVSLMWAGILKYLELTGHNAVMGCVSVPLQTSAGEMAGSTVRGVRDHVAARYAAPPHLRVRPRKSVRVAGLSLSEIPAPKRPTLPPLLRGYLRLGARVCGEPALDAQMGVADFPVILSTTSMNTRYLERLQSAAAALTSAA